MRCTNKIGYELDSLFALLPLQGRNGAISRICYLFIQFP